MQPESIESDQGALNAVKARRMQRSNGRRLHFGGPERRRLGIGFLQMAKTIQRLEGGESACLGRRGASAHAFGKLHHPAQHFDIETSNWQR